MSCSMIAPFFMSCPLVHFCEIPNIRAANSLNALPYLLHLSASRSLGRELRLYLPDEIQAIVDSMLRQKDVEQLPRCQPIAPRCGLEQPAAHAVLVDPVLCQCVTLRFGQPGSVLHHNHNTRGQIIRNRLHCRLLCEVIGLTIRKKLAWS